MLPDPSSRLSAATSETAIDPLVSLHYEREVRRHLHCQIQPPPRRHGFDDDGIAVESDKELNVVEPSSAGRARRAECPDIASIFVSSDLQRPGLRDDPDLAGAGGVDRGLAVVRPRAIEPGERSITCCAQAGTDGDHDESMSHQDPQKALRLRPRKGRRISPPKGCVNPTVPTSSHRGTCGRPPGQRSGAPT